MVLFFMQGRKGKGSIYVWAAGNGVDDSCAADGFVNNIFTLFLLDLLHL